MLWGILHAFISVLHKLCVKTQKNCKDNRVGVTDIVSIIINFIAVSILWIPFRNQDFRSVALIVKRILLWSPGIHYVYVFTLIFSEMLIIVETIAVYKNNGNDIWKPLDFNQFGSKVIFILFLLIIAGFAYIGNDAFIYAQF